jgi:hypothetical protein
MRKDEAPLAAAYQCTPANRLRSRAADLVMLAKRTLFRLSAGLK